MPAADGGRSPSSPWEPHTRLPFTHLPSFPPSPSLPSLKTP
jgi:hypothetical protein